MGEANSAETILRRSLRAQSPKAKFEIMYRSQNVVLVTLTINDCVISYNSFSVICLFLALCVKHLGYWGISMVYIKLYLFSPCFST